MRIMIDISFTAVVVSLAFTQMYALRPRRIAIQ
jgi:hypothetical protein